MLLSVLVPSGLSSLDTIYEEIRDLPNHLGFKIEFLIAERLCKSTETLSRLLGLECEYIKFKIFSVNKNDTIGSVLNQLCLQALGTYCTCFNNNFKYIDSFLIEARSKIHTNKSDLFLKIELCEIYKDNVSKFPFEGKFSDGFLRKINDEIQPVVIWKKVVYKIAGFFDDKLNTSSDIDFEIRLQKILPDRGSVLKINVGGLNKYQTIDINRINKNLIFHKNNKKICDANKLPKEYNNTFFFCMSHRLPLYSLPNFVNLVNVSPDSSFGDYFSFDLLQDFFTHEELLLGELGIFVAYDILSAIDAEKFKNHYVALCYYRKFFSAYELGPTIKRGGPIHIVHPNQVDFEFVANSIAGQLIIPPIIKLKKGTVLDAYAKLHCLSDFLFATQLAFDIGVLNSDEIGDFMNTDRFIHWAHGGCTLPLPIFLTLVSKLRSVYNAIVASGYRSPIRQIPYQRRWVAFYLERLSSFFLVKYYEACSGKLSKLHNVNLPEEGLDVFNPGGLSQMN